eukprot:CAMPEP_0114367160 /NCGR_PEP_ID=MMETSP0101-20121206/29859_1 /TAXON_ID=38822 ORGANISM="Pteridomonas danica, Strain PT" /NCGR_SAMPLE_ID=MMETSP0101 /ASSEMBLY_ACC=CAM_ASM_000211 /LENGTH=184 /DNA_ID=CAMNT_0001516665 /DNA_START=31 /DNA_END=585 /DNA_ORIENTATION=+
MNDDEIAAIIANEAKRRKDRARTAGVLAYLEPAPAAPVGVDINKRFLGSIITSVCGHNRRNQEDQSWRQYGLDKKLATLYNEDNRGKKRSLEKGSSSSSCSQSEDQQRSREEWALRKANSFLAPTEEISQKVDEPIIDDSDEEDKMKKRKEKKLKKKLKKEKKAKRHRQQKLTDSSVDSNSDSE